VEITQDGISWSSLYSSTQPVTILTPLNRGPYFRLAADPKSVLPGEYHGVRITLANSPPTVIRTDTGESTGVLDSIPQMSYRNGSSQSQGQRRVAELTSENGFLTPFTIASGVNTWLVLDMTFQGLNGSEWQILMGARGTRISPE